MSCLLHVV